MLKVEHYPDLEALGHRAITGFQPFPETNYRHVGRSIPGPWDLMTLKLPD